ncbi:hypothetical protein KM043_004851 [Ampulex compressa]|nr:hypothetical protein KM043_004851 [Ampulex compressa]
MAHYIGFKSKFPRVFPRTHARWYLTGSRQLVSGCKWRQPRNLWHRHANSFTPSVHSVTELYANITLTQIGSSK